MADNATVRVEDTLPVRSRISWGAIAAGAVVALGLYFLLTLLGGAVGLSVENRIRPETLGVGAAVWAVLATVISLFVGGYIASQCSVGENKYEALLYGFVVWGVVFAMLLWLMASGVRAGFNAMVGMSHTTQNAAPDATPTAWEDAARGAGVPQERIDEWRAKSADPAQSTRRAADDSTRRQAVENTAMQATWWAFLGTLVSMLAAMAGAFIGAGPRFRLVRVAYNRPHGEGAYRPGEVGNREPVRAGL